MGTDLFVNQGPILKVFKIRPVEKIVYVILLHGADHPVNLHSDHGFCYLLFRKSLYIQISIF